MVGALTVGGNTLTGSEFAALDGITAGTVTLSKAVIVDANKDIGDFRNLDVVNLDAGADAVKGTIDIFPTTTARGKLILTAADNSGALNVTITNASHGQSTVVTIPDSGLATSYVLQSTAAITAAEADVLDNVVAGTVLLSKAVVVDANKDIGDFRNLDAVNIDAGASAVAGTVDVFPTTAAKGKVILAAADNAGDTSVTITNASHGQATVVTIPDSGLATAYVLQSTAAVTVAEANVLDGATAGTQVASKVVVADANVNIGAVKATALHIGATGSEVQVNATPAEINNAADVSARTQELTVSGAVTAGVQSVELNHASGVIAATIADAVNHQGLFVVKDTSATGTAAHTLTLTAGTFNGTNTIATFNARDEALFVYFDSTGRGQIIENVGTVVLS